MRKFYYAVRWGTDIRLTGDPVDNADAACRDCYDMVSKDMKAVPVSTRKADVRRAIRDGLEKLFTRGG